MALMMIMLIMMVMRVMMIMMNIAAMQIKICDHNLIHRVKVDLVFFCFFFVPSPEAPCQFDVPGLACGEKIYLIYVYMSILLFAESQRRKRIHTKDYCLILQRHSQFGKI